jgi:hypothetical protein
VGDHNLQGWWHTERASPLKMYRKNKMPNCSAGLYQPQQEQQQNMKGHIPLMSSCKGGRSEAYVSSARQRSVEMQCSSTMMYCKELFLACNVFY